MRRDPRLTPARPDLAAEHLRGTVEAARFVPGTAQRVIAGVAPVRREPSHGATQLTQALHGEAVTVYEDEEGWAYAQLDADGYVGFLPSAALLAPGPAPTHRVAAIRTLVFPGPSIKLPPTDALPLGGTLAVVREQDRFAVTADGGYVPKQHLAPLDDFEADPVAVAERFLGVPYLWGGKTALGIDCSGLVQVALGACGLFVPRDSDMQQDFFADPPHGTPVDAADMTRGDLLFWKGHVAIARGGGTLIHANAHHMQVAVEPCAAALARIETAGTKLACVLRPKQSHARGSHPAARD